MNPTFNPLEHPACLSQPRRLVPPLTLAEHIPFGMYLVDALRPALLVELGTHTGNSCCGFCQTVDELHLDTRCFAIDTWEGDPHAGRYGPDVLVSLAAYHNQRYASFSRLVRSPLDEAANLFEDGSIDLLRTDGFHTYEAVRHDFETWSTRLSRRGVVLFHDTAVRERDFGVWKLWPELRDRHPSFEFEHGYGLGVLKVGPEPVPELEPLSSANGGETGLIRSFFFKLGSRLTAPAAFQRGTPDASESKSSVPERSRRASAASRVPGPSRVAAAKSPAPYVSVVIPNHNGLDDLETCLRSLLAVDFPREDLEIIVVDNASTDGSVEMLRTRFPDVRVLQNETNVGFSRAANQAVAGSAAGFVAFLNTDMRVDPNWLNALLEPLQKNPAVACAGSLILKWDGSAVDYFGRPNDLFSLKVSVDPPPSPLPASDAYVRAMFASGGAMLIRRQLFEDVGGFDPGYFMYHEDVDLGWRLWLQGHEVLLCPRSVVYHKGGASSERLPKEFVVREQLRNVLATFFKNMDDANLQQGLPFLLYSLLERGRIWQAARAVLDGAIADFADSLDDLIEKRNRVQAARRVTDADLFSRLPHPLAFLLDQPLHQTIAMSIQEASRPLVIDPQNAASVRKCIVAWLNAAHFVYEERLIAEVTRIQSTDIPELSARIAERQQVVEDLSARIAERERVVGQLTEQAREQATALESLGRHNSNLDEQLRIARAGMARLQGELNEVSALLQDIFRSKLWRFALLIRGVRLAIAPIGSRREDILRRLYRFLQPRRPPSDATLDHVREPASREQPRLEHSGADNTPVPAASLLSTASLSEAIHEYVPLRDPGIPVPEPTAKAIAFYLPQFHPIPENDRWWGKGFTEWTNVTKAAPRFRGHYQPHLAGELGFYDLRVPEVQQRQIELARQYGIHGFAFYYYWFGGKRLLERPLDQFLEHQEWDFPFCICWANENWTRRWDGSENEILIAQSHDPADDLRFIQDVIPILKDPRYIRISGRPMLLVYRVDLFSDAPSTAQVWRNACRAAGLGDLYLVACQSFGIEDPRPYGFDAAVEFPPHDVNAARIPTPQVSFFEGKSDGAIFDYLTAATIMMQHQPRSYACFKTVIPHWDNTARRPRDPLLFINSSPQAYEAWLRDAAQYTTSTFPSDRRFVFINAWNEWAEGAHLEPDASHGYAYLQATSNALRLPPPENGAWTILFVSHDAHGGAQGGGAQLALLNTIAWFKNHTRLNIKVLCLAGGALLPRFQALASTLVLQPSPDTGQLTEDSVDALRRFCGTSLDLIYVNTAACGGAFSALESLGVPIITHVHELESSLNRYGGAFLESVLDKSAHLLACSKAVARNLVENHGVSEDSISVSYPTFEVPYSIPSHEESSNLAGRQRLGLKPDKHLIFGCGQGMPFRKGADIFIQLARVLRERGRTDFHMYWLGAFDPAEADSDGVTWAAHLEGLQGHPLSAFVTFVGHVESPSAYLAFADAYVITSREEPFGMVALEAAAVGVPTIAFQDAGAAEFIGSDAGILVAPRDVQALADAAVRTFDDPSYRRELGVRAGEKLSQGFLARNTMPQVLAQCRQTAGKRPAISVIVPNYNHASYLRARLDSVTQQTFQDFELILLDDASTDDSPRIMAEYASGAATRFERNEVNSGSPFRQWLRGMGLATADILWFAESDDVSDPRFLETLLPAFDRSDIRLAYCDSHVIDESGAIIGDYLDSSYLTALSRTKWRSSYTIAAEEEINEALGIKDTVLSASAALFRRVNLEPEAITTLDQMHTSGDWYFILQVIKDGAVHYNAAKLNFHRRHAASVVGRLLTNKDVDQFYRETAVIHGSILRDYTLGPDYLERWTGYHRDQWEQFFPGRPFADLNNYYPYHDLRQRIASALRSNPPSGHAVAA